MLKLFNRQNRTLVLMFLFVLIGQLQAKVRFPSPNNYINDFTGVLSQSTLNKTNRIARRLKQETGFGIAVAIVKDMQGYDLYSYANELFTEWGIGGEKGEGVLLLIAQKERKLKIEVGYGTKEFLPDFLVGKIADKYIVPFLKEDNYNQAVLNGVIALTSYVADHYNVQIAGTYDINASKNIFEGAAEKGMMGVFEGIVIGVGIVVLYLIVSLVRKNRRKKNNQNTQN